MNTGVEDINLDQVIGALESLATEVPEELSAEYSERVQELSAAADEIRGQGLVSRLTAGRLIEEHGVDFGSRYPLISFTEHDSPTNVEPALEGVLSTIQETASKIWAAFLEKLQAFGKWLKEKFQAGYQAVMDRLTMAKEFFKRTDKNTQEIAEAQAEMQAMVDDMLKTANELKLSPLNSALAAMDAWLEKGLPALALDFMERGEVFEICRPLLIPFPAIVNTFQSTLSEIGRTSDTEKLTDILDRHEERVKSLYHGNDSLPNQVFGAMTRLNGEPNKALDLKMIQSQLLRSRSVASELTTLVVASMDSGRRVNFTVLEAACKARIQEIRANGSSWSSADRQRDQKLVGRMVEMMREWSTLSLVILRASSTVNSIHSFWEGYDQLGKRLLQVVKKLEASDVEISEAHRARLTKITELLEKI